MLIADVIGWFGTVLYLANYAYMSLYDHWKRRIYFSANAVAATCLAIISVILFSWQAVGVNGFWVIISLWLLSGRGFSFVRFNHWVVDGGVGLMWLVAAVYLFIDWRGSVAWMAWSSTWTFCFAYLLFAAEKLPLKRFLICNAYAAGALLPQLFLDENWPTFAMESAWCCISLAGLWKLDRQKVRDPV